MKRADREALIGAIKIGRANAMSLRSLGKAIGRAVPRYQFNPPAERTLRRWIRTMQEEGVEILSSPRAGVWMALDADERIAVMDELREQIAALQRRIADINGGRCALASCVTLLPRKIRRRGGLYCCPEHRYQAAMERDRRQS